MRCEIGNVWLAGKNRFNRMVTLFASEWNGDLPNRVICNVHSILIFGGTNTGISIPRDCGWTKHSFLGHGVWFVLLLMRGVSVGRMLLHWMCWRCLKDQDRALSGIKSVTLSQISMSSAVHLISSRYLFIRAYVVLFLAYASISTSSVIFILCHGP